MYIFILYSLGVQIFTNADQIHAKKALSKLGLEDCFEGIICFETLNPINKNINSDDSEFVGSSRQIFDIINHFSNENDTTTLPKTTIICKPSEYAIEQALKIANLDPHRTVSLLLYQLPFDEFTSKFGAFVNELKQY